MDGGDLVKARDTLARVRPENRRNFRVRRAWALLLTLEGKRPEALEEMDADVLKWGALVAYETSELADFFAVLGDAPKALEWLDAAMRNGDERAEWFRRDPLLVNIRHQPGFHEILASMANRRQQRKGLP